MTKEDYAELDRSDYEFIGTGRYRVNAQVPTMIAMELKAGLWMNVATEHRMTDAEVADWEELVKVHTQPVMVDVDPAQLGHLTWEQIEPDASWVIYLTDDDGTSIDSGIRPGVQVIELDGLPHAGNIVVEGDTLGPVITHYDGYVEINWAGPHTGKAMITWVKKR